MEYVRQTLGSDMLSGLFNLPQSLRNKKVEVIILPAQNETSESPNYEVKLGFLDGPPLPDSFFDPLPEEDLQAWGL
ncbi:MAG: hypothetical protein FWB80_03190 [Defluviitaleaceae bacterium]|nr:hypothetical protein [Defluviitaleaceae bacterium]